MKIQCPHCGRNSIHLPPAGFTMVPTIYLEQLEKLYQAHSRNMNDNHRRFRLTATAEERNKILAELETTIRIFQSTAKEKA